MNDKAPWRKQRRLVVAANSLRRRRVPRFLVNGVLAGLFLSLLFFASYSATKGGLPGSVVLVGFLIGMLGTPRLSAWSATPEWQRWWNWAPVLLSAVIWLRDPLWGSVSSEDVWALVAILSSCAIGSVVTLGLQLLAWLRQNY